MKNKFIIFLGLVSVIFQSFLGLGEYMTDFSDTLNDISLQTVKNIGKEIPFLSFIGLGGAIDINGVVECKSLTFQTKREINKDESIIIISKIINEFLKNMHFEKKMDSYLKEHDFTYKNLDITIFVYDKNGRVYHPGLHMVNLSKGIITSETVSPSEKYILKEESYIKEPYEEAAKRVGVWESLER